jgi:hypothetical protein
MAALEDLNLLPMLTIRRFEGASYKTIARELRVLFPGVRGMSARSGFAEVITFRQHPG